MSTKLNSVMFVTINYKTLEKTLHSHLNKMTKEFIGIFFCFINNFITIIVINLRPL